MKNWIIDRIGRTTRKQKQLTNATVVDDAIRFVSQKSKVNRSNKDVKDSDYDEDQLQEEEEETGDAMINHVF